MLETDPGGGTHPMKKAILLLSTIWISLAYAQTSDIYRLIHEKSKMYFEEAVRVRHHLHRIPEVCYCEEKTALFVADYLRTLGFKVEINIGGKRGIKAVLHGNRAEPIVGIRADMDALPIEEETGLAWASEHAGAMHACGHDIHMTGVLMAARILSDLKDEIPGTVVFIFQPCEEGTSDGSPAGASMLIQADILENPTIDAMFGLHVMPGTPIGTVQVRGGAFMANVATIKISIIGKSSHGALPHEGIDAVYAASSAVMQLQSLISRVKDPGEKAVLSIGKINGGVRMNVIAERVDMEGTVRTFSFETEKLMEEGIRNILEGLKVANGIEYEYAFLRGSQFVKNDGNLTERTIPLFKQILGNENVFIIDPVTVGEDFSAYSHIIPSFFFFLGAGIEGNVHHPKFAPDDEILKYGGMLLSSAAVQHLIDYE